MQARSLSAKKVNILRYNCYLTPNLTKNGYLPSYRENKEINFSVNKDGKDVLPRCPRLFTLSGNTKGVTLAIVTEGINVGMA